MTSGKKMERKSLEAQLGAKSIQMKIIKQLQRAVAIAMISIVSKQMRKIKTHIKFERERKNGKYQD
jgi:hypothetical protein